MNHNDSVVDSDTDDENEKLNLGKVEDKNDVRVKKEASKYEKNEIINAKKLSYRDVLVKGRVNEDKNTENLKSYEREKMVWDLLNKGFEIISLLPESPYSEYDFENENYDDLPDGSKEKLTDLEADKLMLKTVGELYKHTEAGEYFRKAFEMMEDRS